jgi:hypothetical protein
VQGVATSIRLRLDALDELAPLEAVEEMHQPCALDAKALCIVKAVR